MNVLKDNRVAKVGKILKSSGTFTALTILSIGCASAFAEVKKEFKNSLYVKINRSGIDFVENNAFDILAEQGARVNEGNIPSMRFTMDKAFSFDQLPSQYSSYVSTFRTIRDLFNDYFTGFKLHDPRFDVLLKGISYRSEFKNFKIDIEPTGKTGELNLTDGFMLTVSLDFVDVSFGLDRGIVKDLNNPKLISNIEVRSCYAQQDLTTKDLRFTAKALVYATGADVVNVNIEEIDENLSDLEFDFDKAFSVKLPPASIQVGDTSYKLDATKITNYLKKESTKNSLLTAAQKFISSTLRSEGIPKANEFLKKKLSEGLGDEVRISPLSGEVVNLADRDKYRALMLASAAVGKDGSAVFSNHLLLTEPKAINGSVAETFIANSDHKEGFKAFLTSDGFKDADAVIGVHADLLNALLAFDYNRKLLTGFKFDGDDVILRAPPKFYYSKKLKKPMVHVRLSERLSKLEQYLVDKDTIVDVDMAIRFGLDAKGNMNIFGEFIDMKSIKMDPKYLKSKMFGFIIDGHLNKLFSDANKSFKKEPMKMAGDEGITIPQGLMGVPLKVLGVKMSSENVITVGLKLDEETFRNSLNSTQEGF